MLIPLQNIKLNVELYSEFTPSKKSILFLHGFTGSAKDWEDMCTKIDGRFNKIALDFVGHGKSDSPDKIEYYSSDSINRQILEIINYFKLDKIILLGYSMGGRAAISFAVNYPNRLSALILESTSAGIKNEEEKIARRKSDEELADFIETHTIEEFVNKWMDMEIFSTLKNLSEEKIKELKTSKLQNSNTGLANSLRGFGTGVMPYLGNEIKKINLPVLLITGKLDTKFTQINSKLSNNFPDAEHKIIANAGHDVHFEESDRFAEVVNDFLIHL